MAHVADTWHVTRDGAKVRSKRYGTGKRWQATWTEPGTGRERTKAFTVKSDAERHLAMTEADLARGTWVDPAAGRITFAEYAAQWRATLVHRPNYLHVIDNALDVHLVLALGTRPMGSLRRSDVQGLAADLTTKLSANSVHNVMRVLSQVCAAAVDDQLITASPCRRIKLPSRPTNQVKPPTAEEVAALARAVPDRYAALVVLLAGTGLRIAEALGLQVSDVDFLRRRLTVERQRDGRTGEQVPPKTEASARTIPVGQVVLDALARHLATYPAAADGSIFTNTAGEPLLYETWKSLWTKAAPSRRTHDLRHYAASALISGGASVKQVQTILGHSSAAVTLNVYSHLWPGDDDRARSILDAALAGLSSGSHGSATSQDAIFM